MAKKVDRKFYLSWLAENHDPWPNWRNARSEAPEGMDVFPEGDPLWPGVPKVQADDAMVAGTGPTLTTLFHPNSRFYNLTGLDRVYLLYQPSKRSPYSRFAEVLHQIIEARNKNGAKIELDKVHFIPIKGIDVPTDHEQIIDAVEDWIGEKDDPFNRRNPPKAKDDPATISINLSPGTPSMHASWMLMFWKGTFRQPPGTVVTFVQGDGGRRKDDGIKEGTRQPLRDVPFSRLTNLIKLDAEPSGPSPDQKLQEDVPPNQWNNPLYQELSKQIDQAAFLGIPIVLQGERGTGKTSLAKQYHKIRKGYRKNAEASKRKISRKTPPESKFVSVTLSEYVSKDELRDQLFGWAKGSFTGAEKDYPGLLGEANGGTLFLDEIHHLDKSLQAALLRPLNDGHYRPKGASEDMASDFNLVVATNDDSWAEKLAEDFRDRIERIVLKVPSFAELRKASRSSEDLMLFWEHTLRRRCDQSGVKYETPPSDCKRELRNTLEHKELKGNWRDLQRMADHVLLGLVEARGGRPSPIHWQIDLLKSAIDRSFDH